MDMDTLQFNATTVAMITPFQQLDGKDLENILKIICFHFLLALPIRIIANGTKTIVNWRSAEVRWNAKW